MNEKGLSHGMANSILSFVIFLPGLNSHVRVIY